MIGGQGTGILAIQDGGTVNSGGSSVGLTVGSNGTVTVTGAGSTWINGPSGGLNIGSFGTGTLTIANGGRVINITADLLRSQPGRCDWNTQHRRRRGRSGGCTRHAQCAERRVWRRHRYA